MPDGVSMAPVPVAMPPSVRGIHDVRGEARAVGEQPPEETREHREPKELRVEVAQIGFAQGQHAEGPDHRDDGKRPKQETGSRCDDT